MSRSLAEMEYHALGTTICELQWISYLAHDIFLLIPTPILLWCDNQVALHIVAILIFHERTKHLKIDCHLVRNNFKEGFLLPRHISFCNQLTDVLTKALGPSQFRLLLSKLGLFDLHHCPT